MTRERWLIVDLDNGCDSVSDPDATVIERDGHRVCLRFDPARILSLNFAVLEKDMPGDFWLDDVKFLTQAEAKERAAHPR